MSHIQVDLEFLQRLVSQLDQLVSRAEQRRAAVSHLTGKK
jgi:hypothetical protein